MASPGKRRKEKGGVEKVFLAAAASASEKLCP